MKDSQWVRILESERHHLEASKTAAASKRQLPIRQDCLDDWKKKKKRHKGRHGYQGGQFESHLGKAAFH